MSNATEVVLQVTEKKKVDKAPDSPQDTEVFKYKFAATNSDEISSFKMKSSKDIAMEEDTFSLREMVAQKSLEEVIED